MEGDGPFPVSRGQDAVIAPRRPLLDLVHMLKVPPPVLLPHQLVVHRMTANLVLLSNLPHHVWIRLRNPSDHKERSFRVRPFQDIEDPVHVLIDPHLILPPLSLGAGRVKVEEMKPLLNIKSQYIH